MPWDHVPGDYRILVSPPFPEDLAALAGVPDPVVPLSSLRTYVYDTLGSMRLPGDSVDEEFGPIFTDDRYQAVDAALWGAGAPGPYEGEPSAETLSLRMEAQVFQGLIVGSLFS